MNRLELETIDLTLPTAPLPLSITETIADAETVVEAFRVQRWKSPVTGFHASDFELAYRILAALKVTVGCPAKARLVEWGSGIPGVSVLAHLLGWHSIAIECDQSLYECSQRWLADRPHQVDLRWASFVPQSLPSTVAALSTNDGVRRSVEEVPSMTVHEIRGDIVYAYPWPGETEFFEQLFLLAAHPGDVLVMHHGSLMFEVQRCRSTSPEYDVA